MSDLIVGLLPPALGIVASPLAITALIAVLLSPRAQVNGAMYLIGWSVALLLSSEVWYIVGFVLVGILPIVVPVVLVLVKAEAADPALNRLRDWLAVHNSVLNVVLLAIVGFLQRQKAIAALT